MTSLNTDNAGADHKDSATIPAQEGDHIPEGHVPIVMLVHAGGRQKGTTHIVDAALAQHYVEVAKVAELAEGYEPLWAAPAPVQDRSLKSPKGKERGDPGGQEVKGDGGKKKNGK